MLETVLTWAMWRRPWGERQRWRDLAAAVEDVATRREEVRAMGMTIAQGYFLEGRLDERRRTTLKFGRRHLGEAPPEVVAALEAIDDVDRLGRILDRVLDAPSWDDLLATP